MANDRNGPERDRGTQLILTELRDLRVEMRADRRTAAEDRRRSDERFEALLRDFREDSTRRDAAMTAAMTAMQTEMRKTFKDLRNDIRTVGLAIVRTLNRHTRILEHHGRLLERIDRNLGGRRNGPSRPDNGRRG